VWLRWQELALDNPELAGTLRAAYFIAPLLLAGAAASCGLTIALRRWASNELLKADRVVALTKAQVQRFPDSLTSLSFHDSSKPQIAPIPEPLALPEPAPPSVPSFGQLLDAGRIGPNAPLLLGFDAPNGR